jgi:excisionase family DNA binding protein
MQRAAVGRLLTAGEVAARLKVPRSWVYRAAREGDLPSVRCGRYRRFDEGDVEHWIARQKGLPASPASRDRTRNGRPSLTAPL